jgi:hypothetical protein
MFLALPTGSTKVIFDRVESLEPWDTLWEIIYPKHILGATLSYRLILNQHQKNSYQTDIVVPYLLKLQPKMTLLEPTNNLKRVSSTIQILNFVNSN